MVIDRSRRNGDFSQVRVGDVIRIGDYEESQYKGLVKEKQDNNQRVLIQWSGAVTTSLDWYDKSRFGVSDFWFLRKKTTVIIRRKGEL